MAINARSIIAIGKYALAFLRYNDYNPKMLPKVGFMTVAKPSDWLFENYEPDFHHLDWQHLAHMLGTEISLAPGRKPDCQMFNYEEQIAMSALTRWLNPRLVMEIGTFEGTMTRAIAVNGASDMRVITVDLPPDFQWTAPSTDPDVIKTSTRYGDKRPNLPNDPRVQLVFGDSMTMDWRAALEGEKADFIFIDGSHSYECAKNDTEKAFENLASLGTVVWHDAGFRSMGYYREKHRVRDAIFAAVPEEKRRRIIRLRDTCFAVYSERLFALATQRGLVNGGDDALDMTAAVVGEEFGAPIRK